VSLVESLKRIIERTYGIPPVIPDIVPYLIGDGGYRVLYGAAGASEGRASSLVRDSSGVIRAAVYYPDALIQHLERHDPAAGLGDINIEAFAALVEEVDHLLVVAHHASERRPVSRLELEHHAGVTKYLVVLHFLGRQMRRRRLPETLKIWARHHLFERHEQGGGEDAERYRTAAHWARRYVGWLEGLAPQDRRAELMAFQRRSFGETRRLLARVD